MIKFILTLLFAFIVKGQTVVTDTTTLVVVRFSEQILITTLIKERFSISDSLNNNYKIHRLGIYPDTTAVVLETERLPYNRTVKIEVNGIKDMAGNEIAENNKAFLIFIGYKKINKPNDIRLERRN